jgi:WD40 repeat protein
VYWSCSSSAASDVGGRDALAQPGTRLRRERHQRVGALAWSPDGRYIASGGTDQIVRVWDTITGEDVVTYRGHVDQQPIYDSADPDTITALAWSPDSTRLASSAFSGPIRVWRLPASSA